MLITFFAEHFPNDHPFFGYTTTWENCALCMFKLICMFFPCSSEIFLKIRTKVLPQPSWNELMFISSPLGTISTPQWYLYRHDYHLDLPPFDHAPCLRQPHTTYPRCQPTATYKISSTMQKYYFLTNHNKSSITDALIILDIQPSINNQCTRCTEGSNFSLNFPLNPALPIHIIIYLFPLLTTYPTNCPHHFSFLHCTKINNYSPNYHYTNCT